MEEFEKVKAAIHAHTQWFVKLRVAIDKGTSEFDPEMVKTDNNCEFGKWLYGEFPERQKSTDLFVDIKKLHAEFHLEAARCLSLAINSKRDEAMALIETNGELRQISNSLMLKLHRLKDELG